MARIDFETATIGTLPPGVSGALTGSGVPGAWAVLEDPTAPAGSKVLAQTSTDKTDYRFPLAIFDGAGCVGYRRRDALQAGQLAKIDRAAGIAVRLSDRNNYYVVRANALEDNVRPLPHGRAASAPSSPGTGAKVPSDKWQELRLTARGNRFEVFLEGKSLFGATDTAFTSAGRVALWTKADSVTYFDDLRIQTF